MANAHQSMKRLGPEVTKLAQTWQLDSGIGFLVRLIEARYDQLYQSLTGNYDITPRQFGVLLALYQRGPLTPSALAHQISCDRNTLSEMLKRMAASRLVSKRKNLDDGRSVEVRLSSRGEEALLSVIPAAAELQNVMLAPLSKEDRTQFLRCLRLVAMAPLTLPAASSVIQS